MNPVFTYREGRLHAEGCDIAALAEKLGTPFYLYSATALKNQVRALQKAFAAQNPLIAYALKANSNQAVLTLMAREGAGADVVSGGELQRVLAAGIAPEKIVFSGVAKTEAEMRAGLEAGILCFNLESEPELDRLERVAAGMDRVAPVSLRINPDVDALTHAKISTGTSRDKFGVSYARAPQIYQRIAASAHLRAVGVDMHIGSQIVDMGPFGRAFARMADLVKHLQAEGHAIAHIDIGGGLGIAYDGGQGPDLGAYAALVGRHLGGLGCALIVEPGRFIVGNAGVLVTRVEYLKRTASKNFLIVDAGMNDLIRPTLYEAEHPIVPVLEKKQEGVLIADVVGPVCESGDYLALERQLPLVEGGDLLAVMGAGAYGAVMSSTYNSRPLLAEIMVLDARFHIVRPRQSLADLIGLDRVPDWFG